MPSTIVICGYGPGISDAVARRFGREGFSVALVARTEERLVRACEALNAQDIVARPFPCDAGDVDAVRAMLAKARAELGPIEVLHWNAFAGLAGDLTTAPTADLHALMNVLVHGLVAGVQAALPDLEAKKGAVLVTGGGLSKNEPMIDAMAAKWNAMGLALGKASQHKLVGLLNKKLEGRGVYVGEVTVMGLVKGTPHDTGNATVSPDAVADKFWELYQARQGPYADVS